MEEKFTDEELAFLRHARFGEMPERIKPDDYVELMETGQPGRDLVDLHNPSLGNTAA